MNVPEDLRYSTDHEWARTDGDRVRVGITDYAQDALGDVVFVDLPGQGATVEAGGLLGEVESTKSVSEIYAPVAGEVVAVNTALADAPETLNADPYGEGWICEIDRLRPGRGGGPARLERLPPAHRQLTATGGPLGPGERRGGSGYRVGRVLPQLWPSQSGGGQLLLVVRRRAGDVGAGHVGVDRSGRRPERRRSTTTRRSACSSSPAASGCWW